MSKLDNSVTNNLIDKLQAKITPEDESLLKAVANTLQISTDAAYRRIKGTVPFSFEDAAVLCNRFDISLDEISGIYNQNVQFCYTPLYGQNFFLQYNNYLQNIIAILKNASYHKSHLYYAAADISLNALAKFPNLLKFKLYAWISSMVVHGQIEPFSFKIAELQKELPSFNELNFYLDRLESTKIFTNQSFISYLNALVFYRDMGYLQPADMDVLKDDLIKLVDTLEQQATNGVNDQGTKINMYLTTFDLEGTKTLIENSEKLVSLLKIYSLHYIWTNDPVFCTGQKEWFRSIIEVSTQISQSSIKDRKLFFNTIRKDICDL